MPEHIKEINDPRVGKALAHPIRLQIMRILETDAAAPSDIAKALNISLPKVSYHVRALADLGLIELVELTHVRGAIQHTYKSSGRVSITTQAWGSLTPSAKAHIASNTLNEIGKAANQAVTDGGFDRPEIVLSREPMTLDQQGFVELSNAAMRFIDEASSIQQASSRRLSKANADDADEIHVVTAVLMFETAADSPSSNGRN